MIKNKKCQIEEIESISKADYLWLIIDKLGLRRKRALRRFRCGRVDEDYKVKSIIPSVLNLQSREFVEVRSEKEVLTTLDSRGKYKGLTFMPEMLKFCGKQFKVLKRVEKYIVECRGLRKLRNTVILDGVFCDGSWHGGCDRTCFCLWREKWLKRVKKRANYHTNRLDQR